jgi:hypothetical protein
VRNSTQEKKAHDAGVETPVHSGSRRRRGAHGVVAMVLLVAAPAAAADSGRIAVFDFAATGDVDPVALRVVSDEAGATALRRVGEFNYGLVSPGAISAEVEKRGCGADPSRCAGDVARALSADVALFGSVARVGKGYALTVKLLDAAKDRLVAQHTAKAENLTSLLELADPTCDQVLKQSPRFRAPKVIPQKPRRARATAKAVLKVRQTGVVDESGALMKGLVVRPAAKSRDGKTELAVPAEDARLLLLHFREGGLKKRDAEALQMLTLGELTQGAHGEVISANELSQLMNLAATRQLVGCDAEACLTEIADSFGLRYVVFGEGGTIGSRPMLTLSLFDSQQGTVVGREVWHGGRLNDLKQQLPKRVRSLLRGYHRIVVAKKGGASKAFDEGYRGTRWGMTRAEVKGAIGGRPLTFEDMILADDRVGPMRSRAAYIFTDHALSMVVLMGKNEHEHIERHYQDYLELKRLLERKYGAPGVDEEIWSNEFLKGNHRRALQRGQLQVHAAWTLGDTTIDLRLDSTTSTPRLRLVYQSNELTQLAAEDFEGRILENL